MNTLKLRWANDFQRLGVLKHQISIKNISPFHVIILLFIVELRFILTYLQNSVNYKFLIDSIRKIVYYNFCK